MRVLKDVDLELRSGEVHGLVGENGAGKSTLLRILGGVHLPDSGKVLVRGREVAIPSPRAAQSLGIALIHQEPLVFPDLSVAENIFVGHRTATTGASRFIRWGEMFSRAQILLESLGVHLDVRRPLRGRSIADQQMVEIAAALSQDSRILLMDEPTASLTPGEVARLFLIIRRLKEQGVAIVFVSHRLEEVFEIADRISVLRDGELVGVCSPGHTTKEEVVRMMVGRALNATGESDRRPRGEVLLAVERLSRRGSFREVSFEVRAGEIVGLAGLVGAGRTEVAKAIFGIEPTDSGTVRVNGREVCIRSPRQAMRLGLAYVPEERQRQGLLLPWAVASNVTLAAPQLVSKGGFLHQRAELSLAEEARERFRITLRSLGQPVAELSGGNQQKVVLAKWLLTQPRILILDEPTRGIDVGAKAEVHRLVRVLASQGKAILMISSDLPELLSMSDRIMVMREGRLVAHFDREEATAEKVVAAASGLGYQ